MLTIPWFVTKTFQDLFRRTPVPIENQQQQQFQQNAIQCEQQQHYQQQAPPPPPHVRQTQVQQQQAPVKQQVQQQQQAPVKQQVQQQQVHQQQQAPVKQQVQQQQQAPVKQQVQQQQQAPVKQQVQQQQVQQQQQAPVKQQVQQQQVQQQQQAPVKQQVPQQEAPVKHIPQQQAPVKQVQQQQAPVNQPQVHHQAPAIQAHDQQHQSQQKQTTASLPIQTAHLHNDLTQQTTASSPVQTAHLHNDLTQQNPVRVQGLTPPKSPASEVSTDFTQAPTESSQHTSREVSELHSSTTSQLSEATPNASPRSRPAADLSLQTSSRTVVLQNSASGGKMSFEWAQKQVEKFQFDFDQADKDKSGSLSFEEVYNVLKKVGFKGSKEEAQSIFRHLDRDQDKKISREEFKATLSNLPRLSIKEFVLRKTFLKLDKDGSGYLTKSEIADATKSEAGLDIAAEKISDLLIYLIKEDTDEKVSYEEFLYVFGVESAATVMRQVFAKLDTDGSGFLTKEEILEAVKAENELKLKADKISDLLIYWVKDKDKKISYNEFVDVWLQQKEDKPKKK